MIIIIIIIAVSEAEHQIHNNMQIHKCTRLSVCVINIITNFTGEQASGECGSCIQFSIMLFYHG